MHGNPMGYPKMLILATRAGNIWSLDGSQAPDGIFQKSICDLENPRLMRMREKIMEYTPEVKWVPGKTHYIADALSRSPLFDTNNDDYTISCNYQSVETVWDSIREGAKSAQYAKLQWAVKNGESDPGLSQFKTLMHWQIDDVLMVILDSTRMVIPDKSQKAVLKELQKAHSGISKTYATAVQLYYWPGMKNCIKAFLSSCKICIKHSPTQARSPVTGTALSAAQSPINDLGIDLFDAQGKEWLAAVCCFSGYAWLAHIQKTTTASVLESLENIFLEYGYPSSVRTDGGPHFRSEFAEYCKAKNISQELASPYNPESNGLAEAAVKNIKSLVIRCDEANENLRQAIATWSAQTAAHPHRCSSTGPRNKDSSSWTPMPNLSTQKL